MADSRWMGGSITTCQSIDRLKGSIAMTLVCKKNETALRSRVVCAGEPARTCVSEIVLPSFGAARARLKQSPAKPALQQNLNLTLY